MPRLEPAARDGIGLPRRQRAQTRIDELRFARSFFRRLRPYLRRPLDLSGGRARLDRQLAERERTFSGVLRRGVFENPTSPYRRLFERVGIAYDDVVAMLGESGLERTLETLHEAGVYVTLEEFKGREPLRRPGLELPVSAEDFDNPLPENGYEAQTGASTGPARRILVDLALLEHESAYHACFLAAAGATGRPYGIWYTAPPGAVGIKTALIQAKLGRPVGRWFSQSRLRDGDLRHVLFTLGTIRGTRHGGKRLPLPRHVPAGDAGPVAAWLASERAAGTPAVLATTASGGVRACLAAIDQGLDIEGTFFVLGGEPFTQAKAAVVAETGSKAACHYAMAEAGAIGIACGASREVDDVHLLSDKVATIQRDRAIGANGTRVPTLVHTTLLAATPKLMLNVDSGDYGVIENRGCRCGVLPSGFGRHLHTIRSHEKLTSEGMTFLGPDLVNLVEEVLPARFGGHPTDYQLREREQGGLTRVELVVRNAVGELDHARVAGSVLAFLRSRGQAEEMMADIWGQGQTLRIVREDPHVTPGGKILPLRTMTR